MLEAVKLLMGMFGDAGEANPTATPWLVAVTLASLVFIYTPHFHTLLHHIICFTPLSQLTSTTRRETEIVQMSPWKFSSFPPSPPALTQYLTKGTHLIQSEASFSGFMDVGFYHVGSSQAGC